GKHRPAPPPGKTRRARLLDPRPLADRERPALGARCDFRRGPVPGPHRGRTAGHGLVAEPGDQPAPPGRCHQHREGPTTSRPLCPPTPPTTQDHLTFPPPC